jgi:protoporphyrinogen oxidase
MAKIYYRNRFFDYPFSLSNALANLGPIESTLMALSYLKACTHALANPENEPKNFEEWAIEKLGRRLHNDSVIVPIMVDIQSIWPDHLLNHQLNHWPDHWPDHWPHQDIYIHSPDLKVGRIQNFKPGSAASMSDPRTICWGMEYFCSAGDRLWEMDDEALIRLATEEIVEIGLASDAALVENGPVIRQKQADPLSDAEYPQRLNLLKGYEPQRKSVEV